MRRWALLACLTPLVAEAQIPYGLGPVLAKLKTGPKPKLTGVSGFDPPPTRSGSLPAPDQALNPKTIKIVKGAEVKSLGDEITFESPLEILYRGYRITADSGFGNQKTQVFQFFGNVRIVGKDGTVRGDHVIAEFKIRFFRATEAHSDIFAGSTQGKLLSDLYITSQESFGTPSESFHRFLKSTTCNYESPHYELDADTATVRPGRRAILKNVRLKIRRQQVLKLPYVVIPLDGSNDHYIPEFGHNALEGYFMKSRWSLDPGKFDNLLTRFDYFSNLGTAVGADVSYGKQASRSTIYGLLGGVGTLLVDSQNRFKWGRSFLSLTNSYQKNNYLSSPDSTYLTSRSQLSIPRRTGSTNLTYNLSSTQAFGFSTLQKNIGLTDDLRLKRLTTNLSTNWSKYDTGGPSAGATREQVDVNFRAQNDFERATLEFLYQRSIPVGATNNFFNSSDRTPVVTLKSDATRLAGNRFASRLPFNTELSYGQYVDSIKGQVQRTSFELISNKSFQPKGRLNASLNSRFRQGLYSDNTAQFIVGYGSSVSYKLGKDTAAGLHYNYLRPEGFSPLSIDQSGRSDLASADLSFRPSRTTLVAAQSSYDFLQKFRSYTASSWQPIGIRAEFLPKKSFSLRASSSYDTTLQGWSDIRSDITYQSAGFFATLGSRYDTQRHIWGDNSLFLQGLRYGKIKADVRLSYNGYLKQFQTQQYGLVYDLHDAEAILQIIQNNTGYTSGRQIQFFLRLKALPFTSNFGIGGRGQGIGTGTGIGY